jgi:hypothetical protein
MANDYEVVVTVNTPDFKVEISPEERRMFCDQDSLNCYIASKMIHEASMSIMTQVGYQMNGINYYES